MLTGDLFAVANLVMTVGQETDQACSLMSGAASVNDVSDTVATMVMNCLKVRKTEKNGKLSRVF